MANKTPQKTNTKKNPPIESTNSTSKEPIANNSPPIDSNDDDVGELFTIVGGYISSGGLERLKKLKNDNEKLKEEIAGLRVTNKENLGAYTENYDAWKAEKSRFTRQLQEKEKTENELRTERKNNRELNDHIKSLEDNILELVKKKKTDESEITRLTTLNTQYGQTIHRERDDRVQLQNDLKAIGEQLDAKTRELTSAEESLEVIRAFLVQLSPLHTRRAQIRESLADMFNGALDYFQQTLGQDIDNNVLIRSNSQVYPPSIHSLPLPASNTVAAKQMRVVAGLMAYSRALIGHIFRPTYTTQNHELDGVLHQTAAQNPQQAVCIRAVLLKAIPERQRQIQDGGVDLAVKEVSGAVGHWLHNAQEFELGLKQVCKTASTTWALIQLVEERIWPDMNFHLPEDWLTLPSSFFQPALAPNSGPSRQTLPQKKSQDRQPAIPSSNPQPSELSNGDVARVVWPTFLAADPQGSDDLLELVYQGYVLTQVQMKGAENEISEASQRAKARPMRRADSTATRRRRDSAVYLSNGNLDGSGSK